MRSHDPWLGSALAFLHRAGEPDPLQRRGVRPEPELAPAGCVVVTERSGRQLHLHPLDVERVGSSDGADVKVTSKRASMVFTVVADDSVVRGSAWVPFNQPGPSISELIDSNDVVTDLRVETF